MEALIVDTIKIEKPWGIKEKSRKVIGEEWLISLNNDNITTFSNYKLNLKQIFNNKEQCEQILGKKYINKMVFPVIIKKLYIDGQLSIQIHPTNKIAKKYGASMGKSELWYILQTSNSTVASVGTKFRIKSNEIRQIIKEESIEKYLNDFQIQDDDIINIPPGTIHSIKGKAILYEIQQNCNITYRVKDFNKRKLEIEKACETFKYNRIKVNHKKEGRIVYNKNFKLVKLKIDNSKELRTNKSFKVISVIKGEGNLRIGNKNLKIINGMTLLIPACISKYYIDGKLEILIYN